MHINEYLQQKKTLRIRQKEIGGGVTVFFTYIIWTHRLKSVQLIKYTKLKLLIKLSVAFGVGKMQQMFGDWNW